MPPRSPPITACVELAVGAPPDATPAQLVSLADRLGSICVRAGDADAKCDLVPTPDGPPEVRVRFTLPASIAGKVILAVRLKAKAFWGQGRVGQL